MKVTILGAGAYALGLALRINKNTKNITIWSKVEEEIDALIKTKTNKKALPGIIMPRNFMYTTDLCLAIKNSDVIVIAVATKYLRSVCEELKAFINKNQHIVIASKGIEEESCYFASKIVKECLNTKKLCTISGPSFAKDMANDEAIGLSLAATNRVTAKIVNQILVSENLKVRNTNDFIGVEICGTMKNIIAIAAGILEGLNVSESTKALFLTECLNDIRKLIKKMGGNEKTILSFAGFGDIILTCTSSSSRNYTLGKLIGEGKAKTTINKYLKNNTVEGIYTLGSICKLIKSKKIKYPFLELIYNIIYKQVSAQEIIEMLMIKK